MISFCFLAYRHRVARLLLVFILPAALVSCVRDPVRTGTPSPALFIRGADLSFLPELDRYNTRFYNADSVREDLLTQFSNNGCNTVRVRLWYNPQDGRSSLSEVLALAARIRQQQMSVWLCLHYSDTWADPGHQSPPLAWSGLTGAVLADSVYQYTKRVVNLVKPEYVQVGNEINDGMLWEAGRLSTAGNTFFALLKSGIRACRDISPGTRVIVHYAGFDGAASFFSQLKLQGGDYDMAGLSYYPVWHGKDLDALEVALRNLYTQTGKPVLIAETAYPFTLSWKDNTHNAVGLPEQLIPAFPASAEGQLGFLLSLRDRVARTAGGAGFCYWGGEYVAYKGDTSTSGSSWENQALFNFSNRALPALRVFKP